MTLGAERLAPAERSATVEAFARALKREAPVFLQRPELLWQQLYNRLQWEDEPVPQLLAPELAHRSSPGATPWLRTRTPFRESRALIRTLAGTREESKLVRSARTAPSSSQPVRTRPSRSGMRPAGKSAPPSGNAL